MDEHLIDTNVLSKIFYGNVEVKTFLASLKIGIDTIVYIECIQGSISNSDKNLIKRSLQSLKFYPLNDQIAQTAIELIDKYSNSRGLFLADAMIAATAIEYGLTLITFNVDDFKFIKELKILTPVI
ncbi:MAG TPA: PIN domain-containing protein [Pyrinomonadaceae bacterium]|jgi:predicted nucleic acid-binding protein|nr:PIN domain-containing protein [Pyrinomonadaceae bacterium]